MIALVPWCCYPPAMTEKLFAASALAAAWLTGTVFAHDSWPQFRGPSGQGHSDSRGLPLTWSEQSNIKWKTPIHDRGWSSPIVWSNRVWLTTATPDGTQLFAICVDGDSGKIIHDLKLFDVAQPQFCHEFNSYASPTPVIDRGRVFVTFGSPGTACLSATTGKVLWERRDLVCNHFRGAGSSPIVVGALLVMNFDGSDYQYIIGLDKLTGKTFWKTDRSIDFQDLGPDGKPKTDGDLRKAFSTPLKTYMGQPTVLSLGSKAIYAYDPNNGKELWRFEERSSHSGTVVPAAINGTVYFCSGFSKGQLLAIRPTHFGLLSETNVVWKMTHNVPLKPSFTIVNELLFMVDDGGIASCIETKTGREVWHERIGTKYSASPVYADGRIYFCSEDGKTTVLEAGRQFKVLAENTLEDGFMASPAIVGKALFLRTRTHLYRIEEQAGLSAVP
jgi:outer membrane protein assembly factor BamB